MQLSSGRPEKMAAELKATTNAANSDAGKPSYISRLRISRMRDRPRYIWLSPHLSDSHTQLDLTSITILPPK
jgi:hypothetical protein